MYEENDLQPAVYPYQFPGESEGLMYRPAYSHGHQGPHGNQGHNDGYNRPPGGFYGLGFPFLGGLAGGLLAGSLFTHHGSPYGGYPYGAPGYGYGQGYPAGPYQPYQQYPQYSPYGGYY